MFALREEATLTGRRLSLESLQGSQIPLFKILAEISLSLSLSRCICAIVCKRHSALLPLYAYIIETSVASKWLRDVDVYFNMTIRCDTEVEFEL